MANTLDALVLESRPGAADRAATALAHAGHLPHTTLDITCHATA
jgi:hypothetical protein